MNQRLTRLLLALIPAVVAPACDSGPQESTTSVSSTTGTDDTDDSDSESETLSTTITASSTIGTTTESGTDSDSTSGNPTTSTTTDPTDPTTDGSTGGDEQVATIYEIQDGTVTAGTSVLVEGVIVTGLRDGVGLFVQETQGMENSGIYVDIGDIDLTALAVGDIVDVTGVVAEAADGFLADLTLIDASTAGGSVTDTGADATATPVTVALSVLGSPETAEPWEGVLITVDETADVTVTSEDGNEFEVSDGSDAVFVDDFLYNVYDNAGTFPNMGVDATFESITGPLNYTSGLFKVAPRTASDLAGYVPTVVSGASVDDMNAGDLIITEIMYDPDACADVNCEYIEIYNDAGQDVNLNGLVIEDAGGNMATVSQNAVLGAGEYGIIGQTGWGYMTVNPLAEVSLPAFNNSGGDSASIANSTITIDSTATYAAQGSSDDGFAWKLDQAPDAAANDTAGNWCYAPNTFEEMDYGSPGAANNAGCSTL